MSEFKLPSDDCLQCPLFPAEKSRSLAIAAFLQVSLQRAETETLEAQFATASTRQAIAELVAARALYTAGCAGASREQGKMRCNSPLQQGESPA